MAASESRGLVLSAVALALFAGAMFWALQGPADDLPAPQPAASAADESPADPAAGQAKTANAAPAQAAPAAAVAPAAPPVDLFAGEMPDFMANSHARVLDKKPLSAPDQKRLYDYGKENASDARPQLLLAWDSMNREWDGIAVRMYRIAYRADPRAKQDPRMLADLLQVAATHDRVEYRETVEIVREAYGAEALDELSEKVDELAARGDNKGVERLEKLRQTLGGK